MIWALIERRWRLDGATILRRGILLLAILLLGSLLACGGPSRTTDPRDPIQELTSIEASSADSDVQRRRGRPELVQSLRQAVEAPRHVGDGGGSARLESAIALGGGDELTVGQPGRWTLIYTAGPHGIQEGGALFLQVSPFWGWSSPQTTSPQGLGFTDVSTEASGLTLEASSPDQQLLAVTVRGRALREGEEVRLVYGAGPAGAVADRFAERASRFWIAVDADGDGVRRVLADSPAVDVSPGPASRLLVFLPSSAQPEQAVPLNISLVDHLGNAGVRLGSAELGAEAAVLELDWIEGSEQAELARKSTLPVVQTGTSPWAPGEVPGTWRRTFTAPPHGVVRLRARLRLGDLQLEGESNPMQVSERGQRILWGDLQNHSAVSDGTGLPEELFVYARDVAALDVFSLTDHDHWGMLFYDEHQALWQEAIELTERFHEPERFVTVVGYEWTHWVHGHRHVLDFAPPYDLFSSIDPHFDTPTELWQALASSGGPVLTLAHHSAGGPVATDWSVPPDPRFEPVTEIVSVHGSSEAMDSPGVIYQPVPGNFVRDALDRGYGLGFVGSSDGHDGHPGLGHLASGSGGLAAILSEDNSRQGVYDALMARRVYATNGPRFILRVSFGGYPMGSTIPLSGDQTPPIEGLPADTLLAQVIAPRELQHLDVIRSGQLMGSLDCDGERTCSLAAPMDDLEPGEYLYVRAVQRDGGAAWSSPFFFSDFTDGAGERSGRH